MTAINNRSKIKRLGLPVGIAGAIALALVATGGSSTAVAKPSPDRTAAKAQEALNKGQYDKAIQLAEAVVLAAPREASYRTLLGNAYLRAGRFESAAQAFNDAMKLGDNSARTALSLALAQIGAGHNQEAVAILDDWRDAIPAADLGLAMALAGETGRGVAILSDALRSGENTPKVRQNLAYAYALDGRWREARLMASQDVPADQINDRIGEWASRARPEDHRLRVASLLSVPVRADAGQPAALALVDNPAAQQLAAEEGALAPVQAVEQPQVAATGELPAANAEPAVSLAQYQPVGSSASAQQPVMQDGVAYVSQPVVQDVAAPAPLARSSVAVAAPAAPRGPKVRPLRQNGARPAYGVGATHVVQLGSFLSEQGARRAWGIYTKQNPELKNYRMAITQADVRGKHYWRVAAAGLNAGGANGLCSTVKNRGGACFAYAVRPATPGNRAGAPMMAKAKPAPKAPAARNASGPANARRH
ncbi:CDC27 family protein [Novosphingobium sp.]|uniref:tetratricopeptide repeat protein n=1 Tax=Novosphingobium sp. TaxID=1874826 RepID=UPI0035B3BFB8